MAVITDSVQVDAYKNKDGTREYGRCTAWVNFDGTGTVAIRDAFNVSSITDNGTGDYTVNFAQAMVNSNYSVATSADATITFTSTVAFDTKDIDSPRSVNSVRLLRYYNDLYLDASNANIIVFGGDS